MCEWEQKCVNWDEYVRTVEFRCEIMGIGAKAAGNVRVGVDMCESGLEYLLRGRFTCGGDVGGD